MLISPQHTVDTYYSGAQDFQTRERQTTVYTGNTGAVAGTGTDTAIGQGTLQVRHTSTTFAAGSGVQTGVSSAASDTILGAAGAHKLNDCRFEWHGRFRHCIARCRSRDCLH